MISKLRYFLVISLLLLLAGGVCAQTVVSLTPQTGGNGTAFGNIAFNGTDHPFSYPLFFILTNTGSSTATGITLTPFTGTNAADFSIYVNPPAEPLLYQGTAAQVQISSISESGTTVTVTTTTNHNFQSNQRVHILGAIVGYNGVFRITVTGATAFTYTASTSGLSTGSVGTATASPYAPCGASLAVGLSCYVAVKFTPSGTIAESATLSVSGSNFSTVTQNLTGTGVTGTAISSCQSLTITGNYYLNTNLNCPNDGLTFSGSGVITLNGNGHTVTWGTSTTPIFTTDSTDNFSAGTNTFTPVNMNSLVGVPWSIVVGSKINLDTGANAETVIVTGVTGTTFTAITTKAHNGTVTPFSILGASVYGINLLSNQNHIIYNFSSITQGDCRNPSNYALLKSSAAIEIAGSLSFVLAGFGNGSGGIHDVAISNCSDSSQGIATDYNNGGSDAANYYNLNISTNVVTAMRRAQYMDFSGILSDSNGHTTIISNIHDVFTIGVSPGGCISWGSGGSTNILNSIYDDYCSAGNPNGTLGTSTATGNVSVNSTTTVTYVSGFLGSSFQPDIAGPSWSNGGASILISGTSYNIVSVAPNGLTMIVTPAVSITNASIAGTLSFGQNCILNPWTNAGGTTPSNAGGMCTNDYGFNIAVAPGNPGTNLVINSPEGRGLALTNEIAENAITNSTVLSSQEIANNQEYNGCTIGGGYGFEHKQSYGGGSTGDPSTSFTASGLNILVIANACAGTAYRAHDSLSYTTTTTNSKFISTRAAGASDPGSCLNESAAVSCSLAAIFDSPAGDGVYSDLEVLSISDTFQADTCMIWPYFATYPVMTVTAAANASGGNTIYTGTFNTTTVLGLRVTIAGFVTSANNGTFSVVAVTATQLTVSNGSGVAETHAGTATLLLNRRPIFQSPTFINGSNNSITHHFFCRGLTNGTNMPLSAAVIDPTYTGWSFTDTDMPAQSGGYPSFQVFEAFTQTYIVKDGSGVSIVGAIVTLTDAHAHQYSCTTNSSGQCVPVNTTDFGFYSQAIPPINRRTNNDTAANQVDSYNPYSLSISKTGFNTLNQSGITINATNLVSQALVDPLRIYLAQVAAGTADGSSCANARAASYFNSSGNWGTGSTQVRSGATIHLCGTISTVFSTPTSQGTGLITVLWETGAKLSAPANGTWWNIINTNAWLFDGGTLCGPQPGNGIGVDTPCNGVIENTANGTNLANQLYPTKCFDTNGASGAIEIRGIDCRNLYVHTRQVTLTSIVTNGTTTGTLTCATTCGFVAGEVGLNLQDSTIPAQNAIVNVASTSGTTMTVTYPGTVATGTSSGSIADSMFHNSNTGLNCHSTLNAIANISYHDGICHDTSWGFAENGNASSNGAVIDIYNMDIYHTDHGLALGSANTNGSFTIKFHDNHWHDPTNWDTGTVNDYHHDGIHFFGQQASVAAALVYNNLFDGPWSGNSTSPIFNQSAYQNSYIFNNVDVCDPAQGCLNEPPLYEYGGGLNQFVANNTFIGSGQPRLSGTYNHANDICMFETFPGGTTGNNSILNNITTGCITMLNSTGGIGYASNTSTSGIDGNLYANRISDGNAAWSFNGSPTNVFATWRTSSGDGTHSQDFTSSNPTPNLTNYVPQTGSPAIASGLNLTALCTGNLVPLCKDTSAGNSRVPASRPTTGNWDVGAYAVTTSGPTGTPNIPPAVPAKKIFTFLNRDDDAFKSVQFYPGNF
jgi:hypothetical protein